MPDQDNQAAEILARGALGGDLLDEFGAVWSTAILRLARASWHLGGIEAFLQLDVPHAATSSGKLSEDAVELVLEALGERSPDNGLRFLELGTGSGLFAKLFLDRLQVVAPDLYANCTYVVSDSAESILASQSGFGVLDAHRDRVETTAIDACSAWPDKTGDRFDGIFATYLLDCLPFDVLAVNGTQTWRLEARSALTRPDAELLANLKTALKQDDPRALAEFVEIGRGLAIQTRHTPVARETLPFPEALPEDTDGETLPFIHCYGALQCLDNCLQALKSGGIVIASDYGTTTRREASEATEFQFYGKSVATGVNFHQIDSTFAGRADVTLFKPEEEEGAMHTRVLANNPAPDLLEKVDLLHGAVRFRALNAPIDAAREVLRAHSYEMARKYYGKALRLQPRNWSLMEEIADLLLMAAEEFESALDMAEQALKLNPIGAGLWRIKGQALDNLGRDDAARVALDRAIELNSRDVPAWLALANFHLRHDRHTEALTAIARGFACDPEGGHRDTLRELQDTTLFAISKNQRDLLVAQVNRFRPLDDLPEP